MASNTPDPNELIQLEREWCRKVKAGDVDWIIDRFASNGLQFPPGSDVVSGKEKLREAWKALAQTEGLELSWNPTEAHVSASNDMAYVHGAAQIRTPDGNSQAAKYVVVWVKENDEWKIAIDIFNTNS
jgi:ketosteroid isomerase-like protein